MGIFLADTVSFLISYTLDPFYSSRFGSFLALILLPFLFILRISNRKTLKTSFKSPYTPP